MKKFLEHVLPFDHQDILLARITKEATDYFVTESQRFSNINQPDKAQQYQDWARRMRRRHQELPRTNDS